ncbi:hypothetical protein MDAP_001648 [Mitosporidium daphniae]
MDGSAHQTGRGSNPKKSPLRKRIFSRSGHGVKRSAVSLEENGAACPSFLDIEIPFDWEGDDGLEPSLDGAFECYVDPSSNRRGDLSEAFIPLPGFSKYSSRHYSQDDSNNIIPDFNYQWRSILWLLICSAFLLGPALVLNATHEHYFGASKENRDDGLKKNSATNGRASAFKYSMVFSILKPQTSEIVMMSKNSIFLFIFIASISVVFKFYCYIYYSSQYWAKSIATLMINKALNEVLMVITIITIQRIIFSKIVSDFYLTVYSERLMDLCFAIQAIRRLLTHAVDANQHGRFCHRNCHSSTPKPRKISSKSKSLALISSYYRRNMRAKAVEGQDEPIEPIISSYSQFRQLLLKSAQFEGIIDSKGAAKKTAQLIYEHFYIPSKDKLMPNKLSKGKRKYPIYSSSSEHASPRLVYLPLDAEISRGNFSNIFNPADEEKLFNLLELSENSTISPLEFKIALLKLSLEKEALSKNLLDHGSAVEKLDHLCSFVILTIIIILTPLVIGLPVKELFATLGGLFSLSFVFGNSSAVLFNSIVFIFITHPFDVGDRIFVFSDTYFVHEVGIYYTVLQTVDGLLVYAPNSLLIEQHIVNVKRSRNMIEWIDIVIDYDTPTEKIASLASKVRSIIESEGKDFELDYYQLDLIQKGSENSHSSLIKCVEVIGCRNFRLGIALCHKFNFQDGFKRVYRHSKFMKAVHEALKELSIVYYPPRLRLGHDPDLWIK